MKTKRQNNRRFSNAEDLTLRRLIKAPETANQIYELAESLYLRGEVAERMSLTEIAQINNYLRQTETDGKAMKKQFQDLAELEDGFRAGAIPIGF